MRQPFISALGIATLFLALPGLSQGQIVRFGPGGGVRVRAPFVRVYVGPGGATSVRAPFTAVDVPGPRYNVPAGRYRGADPRRVVPGPYYPYGQPDFAPPDRQPAESFDTPLLPSPQPQPQPIEIADASTLDWHALRRMLRTGAVELDGQLDGIAHGQGWKEYLATVTLREILPDDANVPPDSLAVDLMRDVLQKYDSAQGSGQYGALRFRDFAGSTRH